MRTLRPVLAVVVMAAAVAFSLAGGAGSGSGATTFPARRSSGRQFCVTITDTPSPSRLRSAASSPTCSTQSSVDNAGGATLTNGVVTATLKDHVRDHDEQIERAVRRRRLDARAARRLGSDERRRPATSATSPPGSRSPPLAARLTGRRRRPASIRPTRPESSAFKEKGNDNQNNDPNPDTRPVIEEIRRTSRVRDCSYAWAPPTSSVKLGTAPDGDTWGSFTFTNSGGGVIAKLDRVRRLVVRRPLRRRDAHASGR